METARIRDARVLLPSEDEDTVTAWPFPTPLEGEKVTNTDFRHVDLASHRLADVALHRCRFVGARLTGVFLDRVSLADVLFQGCRFDYGTWERVRVSGDVAFVDCSFKEVAINGGDLRKAVFDECVFAAEVTSTSMAGTDLRGSDLSGLRGLASLAGARVDREQLHQLSEVMVRDLNLTVADTG